MTKCSSAGPRNLGSGGQLLLGKNLVARKPPARDIEEVRVAVLRSAAEAHHALDASGIEPALGEAHEVMRTLVIRIRGAPADAFVGGSGLHRRGHRFEGGDRFLAGECLADLYRTHALDGHVRVHAEEVLVVDVFVPVRAVELGTKELHLTGFHAGEVLFEERECCHDLGVIDVATNGGNEGGETGEESVHADSESAGWDLQNRCSEILPR